VVLHDYALIALYKSTFTLLYFTFTVNYRFCDAVVRRRKRCVWFGSGLVIHARQQFSSLLLFSGMDWMLTMQTTATNIYLMFCLVTGS